MYDKHNIQVNQGISLDKKKSEYNSGGIHDLQGTNRTNEAVYSQGLPENEFLSYEEMANQKEEGLSMKQESSEEDRLKHRLSNITSEDYQMIYEEGINMECLTPEQLDSVIRRMKEKYQQEESNQTSEQDSSNTETVDLLETSKDKETIKKIVDQLKQAGLQVSEDTILKVVSSLEMAQNLIQMSDQGKSYMIRNNLPITIENLYKAQYSGSGANIKPMSEETWKQLKSQIDEVITSAGLEVTTENEDSAKWLLENQLSLTKDSLSMIYDLNQIKGGIESDTLIKDVVKTMAKGMEPEKTELGTYHLEQMEQAVAAFHEIGQAAVEEALSANGYQEDRINLKELQNAQERIDQGITSQEIALEGDEIPTESELLESTEQPGSISDIDIKSITVRRQLEEIRLKLTVESGGQLAKQGIFVETDDLSKVVDGLREIEDSYYRSLLKDVNGEVNAEDVEQLKECLDRVDSLKTVPSYILGSTLPTRDIETLESLVTEGINLKDSLNRIGDAYEALMTQPRADMGDSITKAFRNVDDILEGMDLEKTQANQRAVKILGYNRMDITQENVNNIKAYDEQVNYMMKNFHPVIATQMIKSGVNPLNMTIESLNDSIDQMKQELGVTSEEKYSKYLYQLEKEDGITAEERKSYIGIYRLLNNVEKTNGAALGSVLKANQEVTMNNLLTAVRTMKSGGVQVTVDDSFGELEKITYIRESITDQLESAYHKVEEAKEGEPLSGSMTARNNLLGIDTSITAGSNYEYNQYVLKNLFNEIEPRKLQASGMSSEKLMNLPVDELMDVLEGSKNEVQVEKAYWNSKLENLKESLKNADTSIKFLKKLEMPTSIVNIQCASEFLQDKNSSFGRLKRQMDQMGKKENTGVASDTWEGDSEDSNLTLIQTMSDHLIDALVNPSIMKEEYNKVEEDVNQVLNKCLENPIITSQDITALQHIRSGISFTSKLAQRECYEVPLVVGEKITNVNVTFVRNTEESGKIQVSVNSETLGNIKVDVQVRENQLQGLITCDNRATLDILNKGKEELEERISRNSIVVKNISYGIVNGGNYTPTYPYVGEGQRIAFEGENSIDTTQDMATSTLYEIGKQVVYSIKQLEEMN